MQSHELLRSYGQKSVTSAFRVRELNLTHTFRVDHDNGSDLPTLNPDRHARHKVAGLNAFRKSNQIVRRKGTVHVSKCVTGCEPGKVFPVKNDPS